MSDSEKFTEVLHESEALKICQSYLGDTWRQSAENFSLRQLSGGVSNTLYLATVHCKKSNQNENVIIRLFGSLLRNDRQSAIKENIIFTILSEKGIGPKFLGIIPEGRLEEFYEADSLKLSDMNDPKISQNIAKQMGEYHKLNMPLIKDGEWLYQDLQRMINVLLSLKNSDFKAATDQRLLNFIISCNPNEELQSMREILLRVKSPVVFCHNDFQAGNILKSRKKMENNVIHFIDFEYSAYNNRAFDIANHFSEWMMNNDVDEYPGFAVDESAYPSKTEQRQFIQAYLNSNRNKYDESEVDDILEEVSAFKMASSFYWSIWAVITGKGQQGYGWGYMEYAEMRMQMYFKQKKDFLNR